VAVVAEGEIRLEASWREALAGEFASPYMDALKDFLRGEIAAGRRVFPRGAEYFRALDLTPLDRVRVVILGQDPYHGPGQAHGLCFSVQPGVKVPPSLANIYRELESDLGVPPARHGHLESWAQQGVLLLNAVLTVEAGRAASHQGKGWERFTDAVIARVNALERPVVFMLWGSYAQKKAGFVDRTRHLVLTAPHPSPLSAHSGFFGCRHFSRANAFLAERGEAPIDWRLPAA
jgi:uracil-DNA glycosylase